MLITNVRDLQLSFLKRIKKERNIDDLCSHYNMSIEELMNFITFLRRRGYNIEVTDDDMCYLKLFNSNFNVAESSFDIRDNDTFTFGVCSDTHINSKWTQLTHLHSFYKECNNRGVSHILHVGDIDEGEQMRRGHQYECYRQGADEHVDEIVEKYPRLDGVTTYFITGNHDASLIKRAGFDIGRAIASRRDDMVYLGSSTAFLNIRGSKVSKPLIVEMEHPLDGTAYANSYKIQKMIDSMTSRPDILLVGHYHKHFSMVYGGVYAYSAGCFQAQTAFMRGKQLSAVVGGWIITLEFEDGKLSGVVERKKIYEEIVDDYKHFGLFV